MNNCRKLWQECLIFVIALVTIVALVSGCATHRVADNDCTNAVVDVLDSVIQVENIFDGSIGSAVMVSKDYAVTAAHLMPNDTDILMSNGLIAKTIVVDRHYDLAILKIDSHEGGYASVSLENAHELQDVFIVGYPLGVGRITTKGLFIGMDMENLYTSAAVISGNSGGGVFICSGGKARLIGVVSSVSVSKEGDTPQIYPHINAAAWVGSLIMSLIAHEDILNEIFNITDIHSGEPLWL